MPETLFYNIFVVKFLCLIFVILYLCNLLYHGHTFPDMLLFWFPNFSLALPVGHAPGFTPPIPAFLFSVSVSSHLFLVVHYGFSCLYLLLVLLVCSWMFLVFSSTWLSVKVSVFLLLVYFLFVVSFPFSTIFSSCFTLLFFSSSVLILILNWTLI